MKIEIIEMVDLNTIRVTTPDERWYKKPMSEPAVWLPSSTWICSYYPKGIGYFKWLAAHGWDEAEEIKTAAGEKGSRVHNACNALMDGIALNLDTKFTDSEGKESELNLEEWEACMSFVDWYNDVKPEILQKDITVINEEHGYMGTLDLLAIIDNQVWLIDLKTSQDVWPSHEIQLASYFHAENIKIGEGIQAEKMAILQLGYRRNKKKKYKWTEVEDKFDLFLAAKLIWKQENENKQPPQKDYPRVLELKKETEK